MTSNAVPSFVILDLTFCLTMRLMDHVFIQLELQLFMLLIGVTFVKDEDEVRNLFKSS